MNTKTKALLKIAAGVAAMTGVAMATAAAFADGLPLGHGAFHELTRGAVLANDGAMKVAIGGPMRGYMGGRMGGRMGGGMGGRMGGPMGGMAFDSGTPADMQLVRQMVMQHDKIERSVTNLPNGIRTVTESADPAVRDAIIAHVASMNQRLDEGREFNRFSQTLPVLFANKDKIRTEVETTLKGSVVTQTSDDPAVVAALQAHAQEVSELARDGRLAMMRAAQASRAR
jgi:hypothetical protein